MTRMQFFFACLLFIQAGNCNLQADPYGYRVATVSLQKLFDAEKAEALITCFRHAYTSSSHYKAFKKLLTTIRRSKTSSRYSFNLSNEIFINFLLDECHCPIFNRTAQSTTSFNVIEHLEEQRMVTSTFQGEPSHLPSHFATRHSIEKRLISETATALQEDTLNLNNKLIYTSIGSGKLFQELVIVIKLLILGFKSIRINLIDLQYKTFLQTIEIPVTIPEKFNSELDRYRIEKPAHTKERFRQFIALLSALFPRTTIEVIVYASMPDYKFDCEQHYNDFSDIITVIDTGEMKQAEKEHSILNEAKNLLNHNGIYAFLKHLYYPKGIIAKKAAPLKYTPRLDPLSQLFIMINSQM